MGRLWDLFAFLVVGFWFLGADFFFFFKVQKSQTNKKHYLHTHNQNEKVKTSKLKKGN